MVKNCFVAGTFCREKYGSKVFFSFFQWPKTIEVADYVKIYGHEQWKILSVLVIVCNNMH